MHEPVAWIRTCTQKVSIRLEDLHPRLLLLALVCLDLSLATAGALHLHHSGSCHSSVDSPEFRSDVQSLKTPDFILPRYVVPGHARVPPSFRHPGALAAADVNFGTRAARRRTLGGWLSRVGFSHDVEFMSMLCCRSDTMRLSIF